MKFFNSHRPFGAARSRGRLSSFGAQRRNYEKMITPLELLKKEKERLEKTLNSIQSDLILHPATTEVYKISSKNNIEEYEGMIENYEVAIYELS